MMPLTKTSQGYSSESSTPRPGLTADRCLLRGVGSGCVLGVFRVGRNRRQCRTRCFCGV